MTAEMANISFRDVSLHYPVYNAQTQSLRSTLFFLGSAGRIKRDDHHRIVVEALDGISLEIAKGDRLGVVGPNGAGKTTLLRTMAGIYEPTSGEVEVEGRISALLDRDLGFDGDATGYENIRLGCLMAGFTLREIDEYQKQIADFTELGDYLAMPIRTYSAGMKVRLAYAIITSMVPEILLMDEVIGAGDASFKEKTRQRTMEFIDQSDILVLASHSKDIMQDICNKAILMNHGQIMMTGTVDEVLEAYVEMVAKEREQKRNPA